MAQTAQDSFDLALRHLERVSVSSYDPTDWLELSTFGFYCLEAAVVAAALQLKRTRPGNHRDKVEESSVPHDRASLRALADRAAGWVPAVAPVDEFGGDQ